MRQSQKFPWWWETAAHCWRTYFAMERDGVDNWDNLPESNKKIYALCNHLFIHRFVRTDQNILKMFFTKHWGDGLFAVQDYSRSTGISTSAIWIVIRRACRIVMEEMGLLDKKGACKNE